MIHVRRWGSSHTPLSVSKQKAYTLVVTVVMEQIYLLEHFLFQVNIGDAKVKVYCLLINFYIHLPMAPYIDYNVPNYFQQIWFQQCDKYVCNTCIETDRIYVPPKQGEPVEVPSILQPCAIKVDLQRPKNDIPKYQPWVSSASWDDWKTPDLESIYMYGQGGQPESLLEQRQVIAIAFIYRLLKYEHVSSSPVWFTSDVRHQIKCTKTQKHLARCRLG